MTDPQPEPTQPNNHRSFLGPAWRYELAKTLPPHLSPTLEKRLDPLILELHAYLTAAAIKGPDAAAAAFGLIANAERLQNDGEKSAVLMMMVLANMPVTEIAESAGLEQALVECWEKIFFDCRDLRQAGSWVAAHVVEPLHQTGKFELAARLKLALAAGPVAVRAVLKGDSRIPLEEAERLFERRLKLDLKADAACEMALTCPREATRFLKLYLGMHAERQRLQLAGDRLARRCEKACEERELAKQRIQLQLKRVEARKAKTDRAAHGRQQAAAATEAEKAVAGNELNRRREEQVAKALRIANSPLSALMWSSSKNVPKATVHAVDDGNRESDQRGSLLQPA